MPQEIDIFTLETLGNWDVNGAWNRPFTSHPKVIFHISAEKLLSISVLITVILYNSLISIYFLTESSWYWRTGYNGGGRN